MAGNIDNNCSLVADVFFFSNPNKNKMKVIRYLYRAKLYHRSGYNKLEVWAKNYGEAEQYFNSFEAGYSDITNISKNEFNIKEPKFVSSVQKLHLLKRLKEMGLEYSDVVLYQYAYQSMMDKICRLHSILKADSVLFDLCFQSEIFNTAQESIFSRIKQASRHDKRKTLQRKRNG